MNTPTKAQTRYVARFLDDDVLEVDLVAAGQRTFAFLSSAEHEAIRQLAKSARTMATVTGSVGAWQAETVFGQSIIVGWFRTREREEDAIRATIETAASA